LAWLWRAAEIRVASSLPRTERRQIVPLTITREQRDAIYEVAMNHLSGIDDVWMAVEHRDFATANRLGRWFAEDLRLPEDLGRSDHIDRERSSSPCRQTSWPGPSLACTRTRRDRSARTCHDQDDEELAERDLVASEALGRTAQRACARRATARRCLDDRRHAVNRGRGDHGAAVSGDLTVAEIVAAAGLGRSTVGKALARLEQSGRVRRSAGGREGARRLPDRWSVAANQESSPRQSRSSSI